MNDTPAMSQVQAYPATPAASPAASPGPSPASPAPQGPYPSQAEQGNWYAKVDGAMGDNRADPPNPGGSGQPPGDQNAHPDAGVHGEPPPLLSEALPPRQYGEFRLPEGMQGQLDPKAVREFTQIFDAGRGNDHQTSAQRLIDMHLAEIQKVGERALQHQIDVWNRYKETQINELKADPVIGGQRLTETLGNAKYVIESFGGLTKAEQAQMLEKWGNGGVGDDRLTVKFLNNIYQRFQPPRPVTPNNPASSKLMSESGKRSWYDKVDESGPR